MFIDGGYKTVFDRAIEGYDILSKDIKEVGGLYGKPKRILNSKFMSYAGISGIYSPFTFEANVNTLQPDSMIPSTASHEMAHQRGFAREDEANYIAYLTCKASPSKDFQYSGVLLGLIHSMNALYKYDKEAYFTLKEKYSEGVQADLKNINLFWSKYDGPIERTSTKINNAYLKSNYQKDGVYSYGRMVDLLIAEYQKNIDDSN